MTISLNAYCFDITLLLLEVTETNLAKIESEYLNEL